MTKYKKWQEKRFAIKYKNINQIINKKATYRKISSRSIVANSQSMRLQLLTPFIFPNFHPSNKLHEGDKVYFILVLIFFKNRRIEGGKVYFSLDIFKKLIL